MIDLKTKKILTTGSGGFLGKGVIKELQSRGVPENAIFAPRQKELDLLKRENCRKAVEGIDLVIHAAAYTGGLSSHRSAPGDIFYSNLVMGVELMEAARGAGVEKFVSIGSAAEYPHDAPMPLHEKDLWNGLPDAVHVPYAMAKRMMIVQGQAYNQQYGFKAIHLLHNNMYGPEESPENTYIIPTKIRQIAEAKRNGTNIVAWGTGEATREFVYITDAARAVVLATENYDSPEPINIGSGEETPIKTVIESIAKHFDFEGKITWDNIPEHNGVLRRVLDGSRAKQELGYEAKVPFVEGIKKTVDWYQENVYK